MNMSMLKNRSVIFILLCLLAIALIYSIDIFHLAYNLTPWKQFGDLPIQPARLVYFVADTPDVIGYREPDTGEQVACAEAVAYFDMSNGGANVTRCCQAETKISCLAGDFNTEIRQQDETCVNTLRATFGVPETLPGAKEFHVYAECPEGGDPQMTVVQMDAAGAVSWKVLTGLTLGTVSNILRCVLAPIFLGLAIRSTIIMLRKPDPSRQIRRL